MFRFYRSILYVLLACALFAVAGAATTPARAADEIDDINRQFLQGSLDKALERIEAYLAINPRDAKARFLKGLILTERGNTTEALRIFSGLTKDYPELPEPYNNLAVLYAAQGEFDKARSALEAALRVNPKYATAYENLGDIYAKMSGQAYQKALQLDKSAAGLQAKIDAIRSVFVTASKPAGTGGLRKEAPRLAAQPPATGLAASPAAQSGATPGSELPRAAEAPLAASAVAPKPIAQPAQRASDPAASPVPQAESAQIIAALNAWANAWSRKDADAYLAFYAQDFNVPGGAPRAKWEAMRRSRIAKPRKIEVEIAEPKVSINTPDSAVVAFRQHYRSDTLDEWNNKIVVFVRAGGRWLIQEESAPK